MFSDFPFLEETALGGDSMGPRGTEPAIFGTISFSAHLFESPFPISSLVPIVLLVTTYQAFGGSVLAFWGTQARAVPT